MCVMCLIYFYNLRKIGKFSKCQGTNRNWLWFGWKHAYKYILLVSETKGRRTIKLEIMNKNTYFLKCDDWLKLFKLFFSFLGCYWFSLKILEVLKYKFSPLKMQEASQDKLLSSNYPIMATMGLTVASNLPYQ